MRNEGGNLHCIVTQIVAIAHKLQFMFYEVIGTACV